MTQDPLVRAACALGLLGAWLLPVGACHCSRAVPHADPLAARLESVAEYIAGERGRRQIPGLSAAVVLDNRVVFLDGFGEADVENHVPATPRTVYRIAGVSKMISAVALLQLVGSGKIDLDASVRDYVPELPDKGAPITVRHVLAHLSGLRHYKSKEDFLSRKHYDRLLDTLAVFKEDPLMVRPGERFLYSTFAYNLIGLIVERVSGMTFGDYIREHIFDPLGMSSSGLDDLEAIVPHRARGYRRRDNGSLSNSPFVDLSVRYPGDGMVSTVEDLSRFAMAFTAGRQESSLNYRRLLSPELIRLMTTEQKTSSGEGTGYGLGCFVRQDQQAGLPGGRRIIGHGGWQPQVSAFLLILPDHDLAVIILANLESVDVRQMSLAVAGILLGDAAPTSQLVAP